MAEPPKDAPTETYRMAIASLEVPHPLRTALAELGSQRISTDALSVAGTAATIESLRTMATQSDVPALRPLLEVVPFTFSAAGDFYMTARNWLADVKDPSRRSMRRGDDGSGADGCWLSPQFRQNLMDRMLKGEVMLLAGPLTAEQLTIGTRVLLRHSNHHVQSHTFVRPRLA